MGLQRPNIRCVVFDIDDTLYLERDYVRSGFTSLSAFVESQVGLEAFGDLAWAAFERGSRGRIFDEVLGDQGVGRPALISELVDRYRIHKPAIELTSDARRTLDELAAAQVSMAVITDGPVPSQRAKIESLGLSRWSENMVVTGELGEGFSKPHPRAFEEVKTQSGFQHVNHVYVADNPHKDFVAPRSLGWTTVRIRREGGLHAHTPSSRDVDHEVQSLDALSTWIADE